MARKNNRTLRDAKPPAAKILGLTPNTSGHPPRGEQRIPTLPPKPLPSGENRDWVPLGGRHEWWPRPRRWS